ncbi:RelA/SpoT family protein [Propylenella binzhouense]|uniref:GTP pyrophosphokinase rsh n=1 Tax=Propylenella binzhouense TaxID=2555902 RepID=A0A964T5C2_9HYPH|nr:bifunctional (p)ppGpp synthetase/guanosine-3',5'-bis(diphosphate) 3'-pyrophosphohydrolase [Propylenella binzhouense]MYZ48705.1 bifunctional (p)ppGpp synthetase/guanosine-3',5'-bis(diphosphate) 3'-pyrophosphohydrolase [Propylenella binzhouense]
MMRQYELVERVAAYNPQVNEDLLNRAYVYAMQKHGTQKRASGDPYFSHPLEVAAILTDLKLDDASVVVALLHDTIEDTTATQEEIANLFGPQIATLVEGLTKIQRLDLVSREAQQAENLRKLLLAVADDIRVLLVKLADRLHNMRTIQYVREDKRARIAEETMEIYAPLAGRMGMQSMREELEDLAFRILNPEAYATISNKLQGLRERTGGTVEMITADLEDRLRKSGIQAAIKSRQKRPYSIFAKMQRKSVGFEQLSDIFGFRVLVDSTEDCYRALGIVHTSFRMVPGRFKDYISTPKQNEYRSLHTTIIGPKQQRVELQIRTVEMDRIAEYGIAAHPLYKEGIAGDRDRLMAESRAYAWLRQTVEQIAHGDAPEEFLEHTKLELFQDQVFCFTPKGRLIALPRGATPIDFAYAVHTDVGDTCVGAKVNGQLAPLVQPLQNGDEVEIIRSEAQRPPPAWGSIVATGKARAAIRRATRAHVRRQYAGLGRHTLERAFEKAGKTYSESGFRNVLHRLGHGDLEDALAAVGRGDLKPAIVLRAIYPDYREDRIPPGLAPSEEGWLASNRGLKFRLPADYEMNGASSRSLPIRGLDKDAPVRFAPEGGAVPGDRIVGILVPGEGITIYPIQSPQLSQFDDEPERWVDVRWDVAEDSSERFPARVRVTALNEPGTLAAIAEVVGVADGNIDNLRMLKRDRDFTEMEIDLEVWNLKHLNRIMSDLRAKSVVSSVTRVNG